jgi:hypothetical protein
MHDCTRNLSMSYPFDKKARHNTQCVEEHPSKKKVKAAKYYTVE